MRPSALRLGAMLVSFALAGCGPAGAPLDGGAADFAHEEVADAAMVGDDLVSIDLNNGDLAEGGAGPDLVMPPRPCADGMKDGNETDVDCGGSDCGGCADGKSCAAGRDCRSGVCGGGVCKPPGCSDGVKNGGETDVDCGGPCPPCDAGKGCVGKVDCQGGACVQGRCGPASPLPSVSFAAARAVPGIAVSQDLASGDFDRDGKQDLVTVVDDGVAPPALALLLGAGDGTFAAPVTFAIGNPSQTLVAADLDGDGWLDVATGDVGDVAVLLGDGKGGFKPKVTYAQKTNARSIDAGDFDGDGHLDLAWVDAAQGAVDVLYATGGGAFVKNPLVDTSCALPRAIVARDLDNDGNADLAIACGDGHVLIRKSVGRSFAPPFSLSLGLGVVGLSALGAADVDGDGETDLVVTDAQGMKATVLRNGRVHAPLDGGAGDQGTADAGESDAAATVDDGGADGGGDGGPDGGPDGGIDGAVEDAAVGDLATPVDLAKKVDAAVKDGGAPLDGGGDGGAPGSIVFTVGASYAVDVQARSVVAGDFTGDGLVDLAVGGAGRRVSLLAGHGDGTFAASLPMVSGQDPFGLAAGDFDGNGHIDLAVGNVGDESIQVHLQAGGALTFAPALDTAFFAGAIAVGDFDGDGHADLALGGGKGGVDLLTGAGGGRFTGPLSTVAGSALVGLASFDLDGDGKLDLAAADIGANDGKSGGALVLLGNGMGGFGKPAPLSPGVGVRAVAVADFDRDGRPDLALADFFADRVTVFAGAGGGAFVLGGTLAAGRGPFALAASDLDRDGLPDLVVANFGDATVSIHRNQGGFHFAALASYPVAAPESLALADLDGDGKLDLVVGSGAATYVGPTLSVFLGKGDGTLSAPQTVRANRAVSLAAADFNLDGNVDLAVAGGQVLGVLLGRGDGRFQAPLYFGAGLDESGLAAADLDGDGKPDLATSAFGSGASVVSNTSR